MNFGEIRNTFSNVMVEGMLTKNPKYINAFKLYVKTLKENQELSKLGTIYHNLEKESIVNPHEANLFVEMNIGMLTYLDKGKLNEGIGELKSILKSISFKNSQYSENDQELHEAVVIASNTNINTIKEGVEATTILVNRVTTNEVKEGITEDLVPTKVLGKLVIDKFNRKYDDLTESEYKLVKLMIESSDDKKQKLIEDTIKECVGLVNTKLIECDLATKTKLLDVKERLLEMSYNQDSFLDDYLKVTTLKDSLT